MAPFKESIILFSELNLHPNLLRALDEEGYETPTPIQTQAIPPVLAGTDLLGIAQTGTGKTAAFALPMLQLLNSNGHVCQPHTCRALILAPTRELAIQVEESFRNYGRHLPLRSTCIFGGVGDAPQKAALARGVDILVATPGRLLDLMQQRAVHLKQLEIFVLDEADRMLDMGFIHDIRKVIAQLPPRRQNLFFSATMPPEISQLAGTILHHPERVEVVPASTPIERIDQSIYFIGQKSKSALLRFLLADPTITRALVFTRMKHVANRVAEHLLKAGIEAAAIHGNKSQTHRQKALGGFKDGSVRVLVATDIAARGIDIDGVSHVFNYDLPDVPETYVHRIGRTARAGASGIAIAFCSSEERDELRQIERLTRIEIPTLKLPEGFEKEPEGISPAKGIAPTHQPPKGRRDGHGRADRGRDPGRQRHSRDPQRAPQNEGNAPARRQPDHDAQPQGIRHDNHDPRDQWFGQQRSNNPQTQQGQPRNRNYNRNRSRTNPPEYGNHTGSKGHSGEPGVLGKISRGFGKLFGG